MELWRRRGGGGRGWERRSSVQFIQDNIYALEAHMRSTQALRSYTKVAFEINPIFVWLTMALSRPFNEVGRALPLLTQEIDGVVSLALYPHLVSQASQHLRSFEKQATCEGCFASQSICSVIFPFTPACPGQYTHKHFRRWMSTIDTFQSGFPIPPFTSSKLIESVRSMACVVWLSPHEAIQQRTCQHSSGQENNIAQPTNLLLFLIINYFDSHLKFKK